MSQGDLQTREIEDDSHEHPAQPRPPANRRQVASGAVATLLVLALGVAVFAALSALRPTRAATGASTDGTPTAALSPTIAATPTPGLIRGTGLPRGVEVSMFALTGPGEGWGTGVVVANAVNSVAERSMVLRYSAGAWTQVGPALNGVYLGGLDMVSPSEGWVTGGDSYGGIFLLHIHNGAWRQTSLPAIHPYGAPAVIAMRTPDEGWMAMTNPNGGPGGISTSLLHYTSGAWSLVRTSVWHITDIAPVANGEAWVTGSNTNGTSSLVHVRGGKAVVDLTSPGNSVFSRLRMFAPNDIWIEGAMHASTNADIDDSPLAYHFDGVAWSHVDLQAPNDVQHVGIVASGAAWGFASSEPAPPLQTTAYGQIARIYTNEGGQWKTLRAPYKDLQSLEVVSSSSADVWAIGVYVVMTRLPDHNGAPSYAGIDHYVLLHYTGGAWTEYGR
jgi:hypothetical protein